MLCGCKICNCQLKVRSEQRASHLKAIRLLPESQIAPAKLFLVGHLNCRSVVYKTLAVKDYIVDNNLDVFCINESWLSPVDAELNDDGMCLPSKSCKNPHVVKSLVPKGYKFLHLPRSERGGGNALIYKDSINIKPQMSKRYISFEHMECLLKSNSKWVRLIVLYRPPPSVENGLSFSMFISDFTSLLEYLSLSTGDLCIIGDFNVHVDNVIDSKSKTFLNLLDIFGLKQNVNFPTHQHGHTLDLVITRSSENIVSDIIMKAPMISDHHAIHFNLVIDKPSFRKEKVIYRSWKNVDFVSFSDELDSVFKDMELSDVDELTASYNSNIHALVEKFAPLKEKSVTIRPNAPWYDSTINIAKRQRRKLEHRWLKSRLAADKIEYKKSCKKVTDLVFEAKKIYYNNKIDSAKGKPKELFRIINRVFHKQTEPILPSHNSVEELSNQFADFYVTKIDKIRKNFQSPNNEKLSFLETDNCQIRSPLLCFKPVSSEEIRKVVMSSPNKSCGLDPIPTWLLKKCNEPILPLITMIVNASISSANMPRDLKIAMLLPLIKNVILDPEIFNHFRPISNLSFVSKIIEKVIAAQLNDHMTYNKLHEKMQSSYKEFHSTETALTCVLDDVLCAIDDRKSVLLLMLDLSAAFDTVDHHILLNRMENRLGIKENALKWFKSYLSDRSQYVIINGTKSNYVNLECGVPQGSVLGPILFNIYTLPLGDMLRKHGVPFHFYADDSQKYAFFELKDYGSTIDKIEQIVKDIRIWYTENLLMCNDSKTEVIVLSSKYCPIKDILPVQVGDCSVNPVSNVKNLGVIFDQHLNMNLHIKRTVQTAFFKLREIAYFRRFLTIDSLKTLIHAYITSRIDYCNGLLYGLPDNLISKLQSVLNAAARLVSGTRKYDHITPVLKELHWLPVKYRIRYKLTLLVFKALNGLAPTYLREKLIRKNDNGLRSSAQNLLVIPMKNLKYYGDRSFSTAGPTLWNILPKEMRQLTSVNVFKSKF